MSKAPGTIARSGGRYRARCRIDGRSTHLGVFDSPELAQAAIDAALAGCPPKEKPSRATLDQLATRLRVKRGTVGRWASDGMAGLTRDPSTGLVVDVDLDAAAAWARARYPKTVAVDRTGVVYFAEDQATGEVKIGWSSDVIARVDEVAKREGRRLRLAATLPGDKTTEAGFHARFAVERVDGTEWFRPSPKLRAFLRAMRAAA